MIRDFQVGSTEEKSRWRLITVEEGDAIIVEALIEQKIVPGRNNSEENQKCEFYRRK